MLVAKNGISREIDEKNLQVYKDKGYMPVEDYKPAESKPPAKPPKKE